MLKSIYFSKTIKIRAFFNPGLSQDFVIRSSGPPNAWYKYDFDYELIIKCNHTDILRRIAEAFFDEDERTGLAFTFKIDEERLAMLILQYA